MFGYFIYILKTDFPEEIMDQIYRIDEKHCLIIYAQGSLVLALHTPVYRNARPHILVNDCLHGLTSSDV